MLSALIALLILLWLLGLIGHVAGGFIWLLLVIALVVFIVDRVLGRRNL